MSLEATSLEHTPNATTPWLAPLAMLIAWIARLLGHVDRMKRVRHTTHFPDTWRDHWPRLRRCEWHRDRILAHAAAQLPAGQDINFVGGLTIGAGDTVTLTSFTITCPAS